MTYKQAKDNMYTLTCIKQCLTINPESGQPCKPKLFGPSNSPLTLPFLFHHFRHFFKMMEKRNIDKGELINQTAWFTRLYIYLASFVVILFQY